MDFELVVFLLKILQGGQTCVNCLNAKRIAHLFNFVMQIWQPSCVDRNRSRLLIRGVISLTVCRYVQRRDALTGCQALSWSEDICRFNRMPTFWWLILKQLITFWLFQHHTLINIRLPQLYSLMFQLRMLVESWDVFWHWIIRYPFLASPYILKHIWDRTSTDVFSH